VLARFIFKKMVPGDIDKLNRSGAKATSGGGAMDFRFNPWVTYEPIVSLMFPDREVANTGNTKYVGQLAGGEGTVEFWAPTAQRPNEGRLARVYSIPTLHPDKIPTGEGTVLMFLGQRVDGFLHATWVSETALSEGNWHKRVQGFLLEVLQKTSGDDNAHGFMDIQRGFTFSRPETTYATVSS